MLEIYIDGASAGHPGPSGIGFVIKNGQVSVEKHAYIGTSSTNHEAEFQALISVLDYCQSHFPNEILSIRSDSMLVVDAVNKGHIKNKLFQASLENIQAMMRTFPYCFIKWIPEHQNKKADRLARQAIQMKNEQIKKFP